jgi:hypothetical protein
MIRACAERIRKSIEDLEGCKTENWPVFKEELKKAVLGGGSSAKHLSGTRQVDQRGKGREDDGKHVCSQLHHHHRCTCREYGNVKV